MKHLILFIIPFLATVGTPSGGRTLMKDFYGRCKQQLDATSDFFANMADNLSSFENNIENDFENNVETSLVAKGMHPVAARQAAKTASAAMSAQTRNNANVSGTGLVPKGGANFNIGLVRNGNTLTQYLPVIMFGHLEYQSNFTDFINPPAGLTCTVAPAPNLRDLRFTYTDGTKTDTIDVVCQEVPYMNILTASGRGLMKLSKIRVSVTASNYVDQFEQAIESRSRSVFGKAINDSLTPSSFATEKDYNDKRVTMPIGYNINEESFIRTSLIAETFRYNFSCFAQTFTR